MTIRRYFKRTGFVFCAASGLFFGAGCTENPLGDLPLGLIGATEPVFIEPFKEAFPAKIDTGADIASIDAKNIREITKNGKEFVAFTIVQRKTGATEHYELPVARVMPITRHGQKPLKRFVVLLKIKFGTLELIREFSLADRANFNYQVLLGKNVIAGNAAVDVTKENTLSETK